MNGKLMRRFYCQNLATVSCKDARATTAAEEEEEEEEACLLSTACQDKLLQGKSGTAGRRRRRPFRVFSLLRILPPTATEPSF